VYSSNCSKGCTIPFKISGNNIALNLTKVEILFESTSGKEISSKFYEVSGEKPRINFNRELILEDLGWPLYEVGEYEFILFIEDENQKEILIKQNISVGDAPIISGLYPKNPPAAPPIPVPA
jgi:hypothetical protein